MGSVGAKEGLGSSSGRLSAGVVAAKAMTTVGRRSYREMRSAQMRMWELEADSRRRSACLWIAIKIRLRERARFEGE